MHPFEYLQARDVAEAVATGARPGARFIAGGTNLVDLMQYDVEQAALLVDVTALPLASIEADDQRVRLGAMARNSDVAYHPAVQKRLPVLSQALLAGASPQLRNMATIGGNLLQRTRCAYFYDVAMPCNKRQPGSGCPAIPGYNRQLAILGTSDHCIASNPSDMCVALAALDASVRVRGKGGERTIPFVDFHREPGDTPEKDTVLEPGELILGVDVPVTPLAAQSLYTKVRDRASYEFALASVAAALVLEGGQVKEARLAFGGVGTKPWRSLPAEEALVGRTLSDETYAAVGNAAVEGASPRKGNAFKVDLLKRTIRKTLAELATRVHALGH